MKKKTEIKGSKIFNQQNYHVLDIKLFKQNKKINQFYIFRELFWLDLNSNNSDDSLIIEINEKEKLVNKPDLQATTFHSSKSKG